MNGIFANMLKVGWRRTFTYSCTMNCTNKWRKNRTTFPPSPPLIVISSFLLSQVCLANRRGLWGGPCHYQGLGPSFPTLFIYFLYMAVILSEVNEGKALLHFISIYSYNSSYTTTLSVFHNLQFQVVLPDKTSIGLKSNA